MAIKANLLIEQGSDFSAEIQLLDQNDESLDLDGYEGWGQMKKNHSSSVMANFTVEFAEPRTTGILRLYLSEIETNNLDPGRYIYDIVVYDGLETFTRAVEGTITVTAGVTKMHIDLINSGDLTP